jgi:hypothetical protein
LWPSRPRFRGKTPEQVNGLRLQVGPDQTIERGQFRVAKSRADKNADDAEFRGGGKAA